MMQKKTTAPITWRVLAGLLLALVLIFPLTGCGPDPESEAKASLEKTFTALKSADEKTLGKTMRKQKKNKPDGRRSICPQWKS